MRHVAVSALAMVTVALSACEAEQPSPLADDAQAQSVEETVSELASRGVLERRQVGQLVPLVAPPGYPRDEERPREVTYRMSGPNAEELRLASLRGLDVAAEYGVASAVMSRDQHGALYVEVVDDAVTQTLWDLRNGDGPAPSSGPMEGEDDLEPKGISNAIDNRAFVGTGSGYADSHSLFRRVVDMGQCTGALFGRRLVFTAAHCSINDDGDGRQATIIPRRRGSTYPYGSDIALATYWPASYTANDCHLGGSDACAKYDFAILVLPPSPAFSPHPGWLGIHWAGGSLLATYSVRNTGYPLCGFGGSPANCIDNEPYSDLTCNNMPLIASQGSTSNGWPFTNGSHPYMSSGCDVNKAHSGGPVTTSDAGTNGPYLLGNVARHECSAGCSAGDDYSTGHVRITDTLAAFMDFLRHDVYP